MLTQTTSPRGQVMVEMILILGVVTALLMDLVYLGTSQATPAEESAGARSVRPGPHGADGSGGVHATAGRARAGVSAGLDAPEAPNRISLKAVRHAAQ